MLVKKEKIDEIVKSHKCGEIAFHVAHTKLMEEYNFSSDDAFNILFPPFEQGLDWDLEPLNSMERILNGWKRERSRNGDN